jgi:lipopolysaccharide/colanic/teichoic acid biosynthesis glycosyltransferase
MTDAEQRRARYRSDAAWRGDVPPPVIGKAAQPEGCPGGGDFVAVSMSHATSDFTERGVRDQPDANTVTGPAVIRVAEKQRQVFNAPPVTDPARPAPLEMRIVTRYEKRVKPIFDRVLSVLFGIILLPLIAAVTVAILVSLGRPVFIRQLRVGRHGEPFALIKFRTMLPNRRCAGGGGAGAAYAGPDRRLLHKNLADHRHTPVGLFLRKWSLDELPQLLHVVRGEMSLVGPRPELKEIVDRYQPWQHGRHLVNPGITGLWQVSLRGSGMMHDNTDVDLQYVKRVTLADDFRILLATVPAALGMRPGQ